MFGLAAWVVLILYLWLLVWATKRGWRWGIEKKRWVGKKRYLGAAIGFLIVYLPIFWDWLPTVVAHKYYCKKEAGFWVYKTLDQWKQENPGVMEGLIDNSPNEYPNWPSENWNGKKITSINQRFGMLYTNHLNSSAEGELFPHVWRWETELLDKKTGEVLARQIDFSSGNDGYIGGMHSLRFWLVTEGCSESKERSNRFGEFLKQFRGVKR